MDTLNVLAIDMGSSSLRAVLGTWSARGLTRQEVLRVPHKAHGDPLVWDLARLGSAARTAVTKASEHLGRLPDGIGVCGWGVDFVGVDTHNSSTTPARAYRGPQGSRGRSVLAANDWDAYRSTGVLPQDINSVYQVAGLLDEDADWFRSSSALEFLPDWIARDLATATYGPFDKPAEVPAWISRGIGSTSGFFTRDGHTLTDELRIPGMVTNLLPPVADELSIAASRNNMAVVRAGSHDTACAAYSLGEDYTGLFLSCGSWAIAGALTPEPAISRRAFEAGLTNEATTDGRNRAQINLTGMWIAQECRRQWAREGWVPSYAELNALTLAADLPDVTIDVTHRELMTPGNMPEKIVHIARDELGLELHSPGEILALTQRSVASACADAINKLRDITGAGGSVALIGGGVRDPYFVRAVRNYLGDVVLGDPESTTLGNIAAQLVTLGVSKDDIQPWSTGMRNAAP